LAHLRLVDKTGTPWGLEPLLSVAELADYLGLPVATIYDWRSHGAGPVAHRIGKHVKFALTDVRAWLDGRREAPSQPVRPGAGDGR
jgi:excisionase family DNA binding protein